MRDFAAERHTSLADHVRADATGALLLVGHGTRKHTASLELDALVERVASIVPNVDVRACWLEASHPTVAEGLAALAGAGHGEVVVVPLMLQRAHHTAFDIPSALAEAAKAAGIKVRYTDPIGTDPSIIGLLGTRVDQAIVRLEEERSRGAQGGRRDASDAPYALDGVLGAGRDPTTNDATANTASAGAYAFERDHAPTEPYTLGNARRRTCVLLVGRGSSLAEANADLAWTARLLYERFGYSSVEYCFTSLAEPNVLEGLQRCVALGHAQVVVLPHYLFTGLLLDRVRDTVEEFRRRGDVGRDIVVAAHLGPDPVIAGVVARRFVEAKARASVETTSAQP